jgi:hypothetical protein
VVYQWEHVPLKQVLKVAVVLRQTPGQIRPDVFRAMGLKTRTPYS